MYYRVNRLVDPAGGAAADFLVQAYTDSKCEVQRYMWALVCNAMMPAGMQIAACLVLFCALVRPWCMTDDFGARSSFDASSSKHSLRHLDERFRAMRCIISPFFFNFAVRRRVLGQRRVRIHVYPPELRPALHLDLDLGHRDRRAHVNDHI
jgi:hypothetical protein